MMTSAWVVETSVNVTSNSPPQDYTHPDDHNLLTFDILLGSNHLRNYYVKRSFLLYLYRNLLRPAGVGLQDGVFTLKVYRGEDFPQSKNCLTKLH